VSIENQAIGVQTYGKARFATEYKPDAKGNMQPSKWESLKDESKGMRDTDGIVKNDAASKAAIDTASYIQNLPQNVQRQADAATKQKVAQKSANYAARQDTANQAKIVRQNQARPDYSPTQQQVKDQNTITQKQQEIQRRQAAVDRARQLQRNQKPV
jgi:hypothetical protein